MTIYHSHDRMYAFEQLPAYAAFLLREHLNDYVKESIRISYEVNLPLLKYISHLSPDEIFQFSKVSAAEFLTYLSENRARQQIEDSLRRWLSDQMEVVGKYDVDAGDITIINYVRARVLKHWLRAYSSDLEVILKLNAEIDELKLGQNTTFANAYIQILKERIEQELHFSQNMMHASPGITYIYDLKAQKPVYINGSVKEIIGYSPAEVLAMGSELLAQLRHPDDVPVILAFYKEVMQDRAGRTVQCECRLKDCTGKYRWLRTYAVVYQRDDTGTPLQMLASSFEISNEKEIASALVKREKQLLEAQALAHIGSFEWDIAADISISTPELRKIFESEKRQTFAEMMVHVHPDDKEKLQASLRDSFTSGTFVCEYRYLAPSGEKMIESRGMVSFDSGGKPVLMTGTVQDISERKRFEDNLLKKTLELERSNIQLQEFASVASHDLKEPLRKIAMFSDIILTSDWDGLSETTKGNLSKITESAMRMQQLIEGILAYSAVNAEGQKKWCSLEALLQEALSNLEYRINGTDAVIHSDGLPHAVVIPFQMQQLFQNLISNALKFSKKGSRPHIAITHERTDAVAVKNRHVQPAAEYLQIHVADNGIGFNKEASEKIFGLFQRLHGKSAYEGSGLGLTICRRIAENHGGAVSAVSEPGNGAVFTITLPLRS